MSITKATILTKVNSRTGSSETDIDAKIVTVIRQICSRVPGVLQKTGTISISEDGNNADLPSDFVAKRTLTDSSQKPLNWVDSLAELQGRFRATTTAGTPEEWTIFQGKVYVAPFSIAAASLTLHYCYEDSSADSITLPDAAEEAIIEGVCVQLELERGTAAGEITEETLTHKKLFNEEIAVLNARYGWR